MPSPENASSYFLQFASWARTNNVPYFYFEAIDEAWKSLGQEGAQGGHFGLWDANLTLKQGMASIYLAYLLRGEPVPVTGSLERFRDFVYIDDAVEAWMAALALGETTSPVYNVGSGSRTTVRELLAALKAALGLRPDHPVQENPGSPSDQFGIWADIRRIAKELQWRPTIPLEVGLRRMVAWAVERATPEGRW